MSASNLCNHDARNARNRGPRPVRAAVLAAALLGGGVWMAAAGPQDPPDDRGDEVPRRLTDQEISRIRYMELRAMRRNTELPDAVTVRISRETIDAFLRDMEGHQHFDSEAKIREFRKKTPAQKLHDIATYQGPAYADKVEITSDPEVFRVFKKSIMPIVLRNCATATCHASTNPNAVGFRLFNDPKRLPSTTYANFITLNDIEVGNARMIDRGMPEDSLLLTYMLPRKSARPELQHPGDTEYTPQFRARRGSDYRRFEDWIRSLKHPAEDYGVHTGPKPPASQPAEPTPPSPAP